MIKVPLKSVITACYFCVPLSLNIADIMAAPITFNTALPVGRGEVVLRQQLITSESSAQAGIDSSRRQTDIVSTVAYGLTPKFTVFGNLALTDRSLSTPFERRTEAGLADSQFFARYTVFSKDAVGTTFRIAPFVGLELATGDNQATDTLGRLPANIQTGSGSADFFVGTVLTYNKVKWGIDAQIRHQQNSSDAGFRFGDVTQLDLSYRKLLLPKSHYFLNGLIEFNLVDTERNTVNGSKDNDSGGTNLFISPGIQYISQTWIFESAVQLPLLRNQNGNSLRPDYSARIGFRRNF